MTKDQLVERERDIVREREAQPATLYRTLAETWGISAARVRQIYERAKRRELE